MVITIEQIKVARSLALRKRVWYKNFDNIDRGIINLSIKLIECIKSPLLARMITDIMVNIQSFLKGEFIRHLEVYGISKMRAVINYAERLGCREALSWASESYARMLALNNLYSPVGWRHFHE